MCWLMQKRSNFKSLTKDVHNGRIQQKPFKDSLRFEFCAAAINAKYYVWCAILYSFNVIIFYMLSNFKLSVVVPVTALTYIFNIVVVYRL